MNIIWHGLSCFSIDSKKLQNNFTLVIDPYENSTGLKLPRALTAHMTAVSHNEADANNVKAVQGDPFVISMAGEYEVGGVFVYAINADRKAEGKGRRNLLFIVEAEDMRVAHLGALDRALTDKELEGLQNVDILMLPVGGKDVMTPKVASEVIGQVEPRVVIPMNHAVPGLKEKSGTADTFCKELGVCRREDANKYKVARKDLPEEDMLVMVLSKA